MSLQVLSALNAAFQSKTGVSKLFCFTKFGVGPGNLCF